MTRRELLRQAMAAPMAVVLARLGTTASPRLERAFGPGPRLVCGPWSAAGHDAESVWVLPEVDRRSKPADRGVRRRSRWLPDE